MIVDPVSACVRFDKKSLTRRWLTCSAVLVRVLAFG